MFSEHDKEINVGLTQSMAKLKELMKFNGNYVFGDDTASDVFRSHDVMCEDSRDLEDILGEIRKLQTATENANSRVTP